jgi:hypothetical protein
VAVALPVSEVVGDGDGVPVGVDVPTGGCALEPGVTVRLGVRVAVTVGLIEVETNVGTGVRLVRETKMLSRLQASRAARRAAAPAPVKK